MVITVHRIHMLIAQISYVAVNNFSIINTSRKWRLPRFKITSVIPETRQFHNIFFKCISALYVTHRCYTLTKLERDHKQVDHLATNQWEPICRIAKGGNPAIILSAFLCLFAVGTAMTACVIVTAQILDILEARPLNEYSAYVFFLYLLEQITNY